MHTIVTAKCRYVSFVEIFLQKGVVALEDGGWENGYRWGTLLFFGGMAITAVINVIVHRLSDAADKKKARSLPDVSESGKEASATKDAKDLEAGTVTSDSSDSAPIAAPVRCPSPLRHSTARPSTFHWLVVPQQRARVLGAHAQAPYASSSRGEQGC